MTSDPVKFHEKLHTEMKNYVDLPRNRTNIALGKYEVIVTMRPADNVYFALAQAAQSDAIEQTVHGKNIMSWNISVPLSKTSAHLICFLLLHRRRKRILSYGQAARATN